MKKFFLPLTLVVSGLLFSCATTEAVPESKPDAAQIEVETEVEKTTTENSTIEEKATETKAPEPIVVETKESETVTDESTDVSQTEDEEPEITEPEEEQIQIFETNGITKKVGSLESAEKIANFEMKIPKTFAVYKPLEYSAQDEYKINVTYKNTKNAEESFVVRKAVGNLDVSEDFKKYSFTKILVENGIRVVAKGSEDGLYTIATWTGTDFTYSIESNVGFPKEVIFALIGEVN